MFVTALTHLISLPFHICYQNLELQNDSGLLLTKEGEQIKGISILLLVVISYVVKSHSKSNNIYKQDETIQMLDFLITACLSCLVDGCFNKWLVFQWVGIVRRYSAICFYISLLFYRELFFLDFSIYISLWWTLILLLYNVYICSV
jgi:hypothetical protein